LKIEEERRKRMREGKYGEIGGSSRGRYIRNTADIHSKWKDIRSITDILKLGNSR
jgi:hypothetical protein